MAYLRLAAAASVRIAAALVALLVFSSSAWADQSAADIWKRSLALYAGLKSYSDTGTVVFESPGLTETHKFTTRYSAPRTVYFDFNKFEDADRFVIWSDDEAFHTWWRTTGLADEYPKGSGIMAFSQADYLSNGAALQILPLIFSQSGLQGTLTNVKNLSVDGTEKINGRPCFRLVGRTSETYTQTGKEVNIRPLTLWIDSETYLIRKVYEDTPKGTPVNEYLRRTTTFNAAANPNLDPKSFHFEPPTNQ